MTSPKPPARPRARERVAGAGRAVGRGGRAGIRLVGRGGAAAGRRFRSFADADGAADTGLARLTELHAVNVAGDAALTVSLAGTVFALPTDEARGRVALFLLLTMAPFVLLAPLIGPLLDRFRHGRRWALGTTLATRAFLAWVLATAVVEDSPWLFPAALGCLVASRSYAVARAAAVPRLLPEGISLVTANSPAHHRRAHRHGHRRRRSPGRCHASGRTGPCGWRSPSTSRPPCSPSGCRPASTRPRARSTSTAHRCRRSRCPARNAAPGGCARSRRSVRYVLWITTGARMLSGFLTLFLAFLMREHPLPGWSGPTVLALVVGAAGVGNAAGSLIGNRRRSPDPEVLATAMAAIAVVATLLTALLYSLWTLMLLGLVTGLFAQLAKLSLDALIQRDVEDAVRARVFSWAETILQGFWVVGGAVGIAIPLDPVLGFLVVTAMVVAAFLVALRSRRLGVAPRARAAGTRPAR